MRSTKLDSMRGIAIVLMVAFHANYLLVHTFGIALLDVSEFFWYLVGKIAATLFLFISGVAFFLFSHDKSPSEVWRRSFKRVTLLAIVAIGISVVTFFFARDEFIVFGIIHFFAVSSCLLLFFWRFWKANALIGTAMIGVGVVFDMISVQSEYLYFFGLKSIHFASGDYYPIFPWFGVVLIGYTLAQWLDEKCILESALRGSVPGDRLPAWFGRYSLAIYVVHVPVLYGVFSVIFGK